MADKPINLGQGDIDKRNKAQKDIDQAITLGTRATKFNQLASFEREQNGFYVESSADDNLMASAWVLFNPAFLVGRPFTVTDLNTEKEVIAVAGLADRQKELEVHQKITDHEKDSIGRGRHPLCVAESVEYIILEKNRPNALARPVAAITEEKAMTEEGALVARTRVIATPGRLDVKVEYPDKTLQKVMDVDGTSKALHIRTFENGKELEPKTIKSGELFQEGLKETSVINNLKADAAPAIQNASFAKLDIPLIPDKTGQIKTRT